MCVQFVSVSTDDDRLVLFQCDKHRVLCSLQSQLQFVFVIVWRHNKSSKVCTLLEKEEETIGFRCYLSCIFCLTNTGIVAGGKVGAFALSKFWVVGKVSCCQKILVKNAKFGDGNPHLRSLRQNEILSTHSLLCRKLAMCIRKLQLPALPTFLNPQRHCLHILQFQVVVDCSCRFLNATACNAIAHTGWPKM